MNDTNKYARYQTNTQFILLCLCSFGLYLLYWIYTKWCFFRDKDDTVIKPAFRTIFNIVFVFNLLGRINRLAVSEGIAPIPSLVAGSCFILFGILSNLASNMGTSSTVVLSMILLFTASILCLVPSQNQWSAYWYKKMGDSVPFELTNVEKIILVLGGSLWGVLLLNLFSTL
jgi:hypothetical protein